MNNPPNDPTQWGALIAFLLGRTLLVVGFAAWGFILFQIFGLAAAEMAPAGFHDEGSNNLGTGIGWAIRIGLVLIGALLAFFGALIGRGVAKDPGHMRIFRFAAILNGSLLGFVAIVALIYRFAATLAGL